MEENSDAQMETDVPSSADLSVEATTKSHESMQTHIVVEELKEEDWPEDCVDKHVESVREESPTNKETMLNNKEIPLNTAESNESLSVPVVVIQKNPQSPAKSKSSKEFQLLPTKDTLVVRTYSRSPVSLLKDSQISLPKLDQSANKQPVQEISDLSSKSTGKKDFKSPIKDQQKHLQKSPTKPEQSKDIQLVKDTLDRPNKIALKKDFKSPTKDKGLQKSPTNPEPCEEIQCSLDTADSSDKTTPKKGLKSPKGQQKALRSLLKSDLSKDIQPQTEVEDCRNKKSINQTSTNKPEVEVSKDIQDTKFEHKPIKIACNDSIQIALENPLLLSALSGQAERKKSNEIIEVKKIEENSPIIISDSSAEVISEKSSDSSQGIIHDSTEVHNKSISRELKSLIKSAKESKIISECNQLTTKTRKSRGALDVSTTSSTNGDTERTIESRRNSDNNTSNSNCNDKVEKASLKRSMRSQNPEFVNKVKLFLNSVTGKVSKPESENISEEEMEERKIKDSSCELLSRSPKKKKQNETDSSTAIKTQKIRSDPYCWRCHWAVEQEANDKQHPPMMCTVCPRSFHYKCLSGSERSKIISEKNWVCPECLIVLNAESSETRSLAMKKISLGCLCELLKYALDRMMDLNGVEPFMQPVDRVAFPDYDKYVVHAMDLLIMKNNINEGLYGSTEAFLADAQWILHNSIIFNTLQSKLTAAARALVRSCKAEMGEIEACPECYAAAHSRRPTWFTDVCTTPHMLLWAKLKGFPYWPAKCMSVSSANLVDVRFFGAHDRAWVPARDCFLFSEKDPNNFRTKRQDILDSMQEAEQHIRNISRKYGKFVYPPFKTQLDPMKLTEQLKMMIPSFEGELKIPVKDKPTPKLAKNKSRSNSKASKSSSNDGEVSDSEDTKTQPRKMADGAEIAMVEDFSIDKDTSFSQIEVVEKPKEIECRKRRRSELEEAVITIMDGPKVKRKCTENRHTPQEIQLKTEVVIDKPVQEETPGKKVETEKDNELKLISTVAPLDEKKILNNSLSPESKRPPIKMILKTNRCFKQNPSKKIYDKPAPFKIKMLRIEKKKSVDKEKHEVKSHKRRNSKNKSLKANTSLILIADKNDENKTSDVIDNSSGKSKNKTQVDAMDDDTVKVDSKLGDNNVSKSKENDDQKEESNCKPEEENIKNLDSPKAEEEELTKENNSVKSKEAIKDKDNSSTKAIDGEKIKDTNGKINKDSPKTRTNNTPKYKETVGNIHSDKSMSAKRNSIASPKTIKDRTQTDEDNTSLAVIARESLKRGSLTGLPTISSVRSLSSPQTIEGGIKTSIYKVIETNTDSSIFTPTSTDTVRNMKEAVTKLNKLRTDTDQSLVGKVGVCAFARMPFTSPKEKNANKTKETVDVEIKAEPIDFDDADRQVEKLQLMKTFSLRPVSAIHASANLREVRINKITAGPANSRKPTKPAEPKTRAKKTFPQGKKAEDGRSELNSKNSMVYIPIQPPVTQAPVRMTRPVIVNGTSTPVPVSRANVAVVTSNKSVVVSTPSSTQVVLPLPLPPPQLTPTLSAAPPPATVTVVSVSSNASTPLQTFPPVGSIPTTLHSVHTVPLITSVNGQWTFSLQPIMSVGGLDVLDDESTTPLLNGLSSADRPTGLPAIMPATNGPTIASPFPIAPKPPSSSAAPTTTPSPKLPVPPLQPLLQSASPLTLNRTATDDTPGSVGEPPRLQHKPLLHPFDANTPLGAVPPPSTAGPITAKLNQNAIKLTDFFRTILEDTIERLEEPAAEVTSLKLQLEETRWRHQQEIDELKHNHELVLAEMRATFEKDRVRAVNEARCAAQVDLEAAVKVAKSKQWCANCSQEAQFYCCWNTSYCDYACQRAHWTQHYSVCMQQRTQDSNTNTDTESNSVNNRLQSPSDSIPKTSAPTLSKAPVPRVFNQDQQSAPQSIIVSMVEDRSGNTTVKCVGTYKPSAPAQAQPLVTPPLVSQPVPAQMPNIVNKSVNIVNNDEVAAKKVVTSGGYLIVGAPNTTPLVTPARRPQTVQYFS